MNIPFFSLLAHTWQGGEEMQPDIAVTERQMQRLRGWEAGMKVFAGTQARSRTIEIIIDHGIDFFGTLELKSEWRENSKWNPSVWEREYTINQLTKSFSIHVALGHSHREGPHLLIKEKSWHWLCLACGLLSCSAFPCECVCDVNTLQEHLQHHTSEELLYFRVQIVLLRAKCSLSYLWMRALWHLATGLIEHRCEPYSIWRRSKGGDPRLVSDLQGVWMQLLGIELPR